MKDNFSLVVLPSLLCLVPLIVTVKSWQLERRAQQVWVPVTVATLVPGVIFLAVPFLAALKLFSNA